MIKRSLPLIRGPAGTDAPRLKRLLLPQGELAQFYDSEEGIRYMALVELYPGRNRGNHYHEFKEELIYVFDGKTQLLVEDIDTKSHASLSIARGDLIIIPTRIAHALQPTEPGRAIEFSKARFAPNDIFPYPLV